MQYHMTKLRGSRVNEVLKMTQAISGGAAKYPKCQIPVHYKGLKPELDFDTMVFGRIHSWYSIVKDSNANLWVISQTLEIWPIF